LAAATQCFAPSWEAHGLHAPAEGGLYRHGYIGIAPPSLLMPGHGDAPSPRRWALNPYTLRAAARPALPEALRRALKAGRRPRVYLSFGTVFNQQPALVAAAHALLSLGAELVVTVGANGDPQRFAPRLPQLHVYRFIDQAALLPCCDAVVSHGGAGTLLGAAAHGLPQLVLPQGADHFRNARALAAAGAGLMLAPAAQTADGLRAAARQLFADGRYASAAKRLAAEMAAMPTADELASALAGGTTFKQPCGGLQAQTSMPTSSTAQAATQAPTAT
jgi:UDP:flavonoid glycosyltransferase YjiC (YdhE family)